MPATTTRKTTKPTTRRRVAPKPKPAPVVVTDQVSDSAPVQKKEREFWVLWNPFWKDFDGPEYFYDGQIDVKRGIASVPVARTDWVRRLLFSNYTFADPRDEIDFNATEA